MWEQLGFAAKYGKMAMQSDWPEYDESKTVDSVINIAVQVNGKFKTTISAPVDSADDAVVAAACADEKIAKLMNGMKIVRQIVVKNKLVNLILKPEN